MRTTWTPLGGPAFLSNLDVLVSRDGAVWGARKCDDDRFELHRTELSAGYRWECLAAGTLDAVLAAKRLLAGESWEPVIVR